MAARDRTVEARLGRLEDEQAIMDVQHAFVHAMDYQLEAEFLDCWVADGVLVWPGQPPFEGTDAILAALRRLAARPHQKHVVVDPWIRIDGDRATVDAYFMRLALADGAPQVASYGRYRDVLLRCADGRWRFSERSTERDPWPGADS